jgi:subtilisin family serine protease
MMSVVVRMAERPVFNTVEGRRGRNERAERSKRVIERCRQTALKSQKDIIAMLAQEQAKGRVATYTPLWICNGLAIKAVPDVIRTIAQRNDVQMVLEDYPLPLPVVMPAAPLQAESLYTWNIEQVRAPEVWEKGYDGEGVVVGIFDTGVDGTHPDLAEKYRGGTNSWYDPHGEHDFPVDVAGAVTGHGTHVAGIILGGDASGTHIGVAPGATWIAARIWNDAGDAALSSDVHGIFQWFMDPDGDSLPDDAPDVVNCSWGFTLYDSFPWCLEELRNDISAWRDAGIIAVFSAGNSGPRFFSGESPGNYPETIAVGATTMLDRVAAFSSRGPGNCDRKIFPDLAAPGLAVFSSAPGGSYQAISGTSQAAPHVTGIIALMLDARPGLSMDEIESILKKTAKHTSVLHPNYSSGWGRADALSAVNAALP